jgi:two-component system phosphate regulon sensor histidine kinase PhoR
MASKRRLLWQLYPSYLLIMVISLIAVTWYATSTMRAFFFEQTEVDLEARARLFEAQIRKYWDPPDEATIHAICRSIGKKTSTRMTVILPSGKVIGDSLKDPENMDNHRDRPEVLMAMRGRCGKSTRFSLTLNQTMMYVAVPLHGEEKLLALVRAAIPIDGIDVALRRFQVRIATGGLVIAVFGALLSLIVSRRITRSIREIRRGAECFAEGDFECRLPDFELEEMGSLATTMNKMAEEIQERIQTITRQRNELEGVLSSMVEGVIAVDMEERILRVNEAAGSILNADPKELEGRSVQEGVRNTELQRFVSEALSSQQPVEKELAAYDAQGERILNGHGTVLRDAAGKRIGALIVLNDMTRLRKLEGIRRDFVANVSHELKTPITAIKGFVETLRDESVKDEQDRERFLAIVGKHADRLEAIIEDLLSLSRIEQGREEETISLREQSLRSVLLGAIQLCQTVATDSEMTISLSCSESIVAKINAPLLEQAMVNLLDNAVKYSDPGKEIRVGAVQSEEEWVIAVRDEGWGIAKKHISRIFERFYRVDTGRSRHLGGTGLGLAIVKHIAQAHGGTVSIESRPGKGSVFSLHIPRK